MFAMPLKRVPHPLGMKFILPPIAPSPSKEQTQQTQQTLQQHQEQHQQLYFRGNNGVCLLSSILICALCLPDGFTSQNCSNSTASKIIKLKDVMMETKPIFLYACILCTSLKKILNLAFESF
jgi:hypothetical protein